MTVTIGSSIRTRGNVLCWECWQGGIFSAMGLLSQYGPVKFPDGRHDAATT